jgi:hypothetical protein
VGKPDLDVYTTTIRRLTHCSPSADIQQNIKTSVVSHPPYSLDVAPADFFLFPKLKNTLNGRPFQTIEESQENVIRELHHHGKCVTGSFPAMEETLQTVYGQKRGLI